MQRLTININDIEIPIFVYNGSKDLTINIGLGSIYIKVPDISIDQNKVLEIVYNFLEKYGVDKVESIYFKSFLLFGSPYKFIEKDIKKKYLIFHKRRIIILNNRYKNDFLNYLYNKLKKFVNRRFYKLFKKIEVKKEIILDIKSFRSYYAYLKGNKLVLNSLLITFPKQLIDYVITHELIHLLVPNHSIIFKNILYSFYPNTKQLEKELKKWTIVSMLNKNIINLLFSEQILDFEVT